ncbi:MAG TPA: FHA domain-containing protein [Pirellulaceae bacterium]|nr:FHA domain-containing protein [Pirellulaceae bacterium]
MSHPPLYWCTRRLLVTVEGPQGQSVVPLARPFARIGRQRGSDIVLESPWVAKRSVYLHASDEGVFCVYMQPEETNTQRMGYWIGLGEPLLVGPYRISATLEGDPPGLAPAFTPLDEWGSASPPYPVFQVYSGGKLRDKRKFRARLNLIGRRHECALQIKGQQVSAFHGVLYWHQSRLWYVDLASSNGSSVNGVAIDCAEIRVGDRLDAGEFTLLFERLSQRGSQPHSGLKTPGGEQLADMLPAELEDDLPPELDEEVALGLADLPAGQDEHSSPVIPLEPEPSQPAHAATVPSLEVTALAPIQQTRQELAVLQKRVEELTQLTARTGQHAAAQLAQKTREAFERERQRIAQELEKRGSELAREKQALEAQWQSASRELATQVNQLRNEANQLATQRQAMEQSRLLWDQQRRELESQLRSYAEQLQRLEQGSVYGLPDPPEGALSLPANRRDGEARGRTGIVPVAAGEPGPLVAHSRVVDAQVESHDSEPFKQPLLLEGSLAAAPAPAEAPSANGHTSEPCMQRELPVPLAIKGRKAAAKVAQAFDSVTDRIVEREQDRYRTMLIVGIVVSVAAIALSTALVVAAVLWR